MIDTFSSVGANRIHVTKTDINNDVAWGKAYSPEDLRKVLPAMVRVAGKLEDCNILEKKTGNVIGKARAGGKEQGTRNPTGSVDTADTKGNSLPIRESQNKHPQNNPPQDISKKNPPQGTDSQQQGQIGRAHV